MPFNGSGVLVRTYDWTDDRDGGVKINADRMDTETDDLFSAVNAILGGTQDFIGTIKGTDGTAGAPAFSFTDDTDTGLFRSGTDTLDLSTGGTARITINTADVTSTLPIHAPDGSAAAPALSFSDETDNGLYRAGADSIGFSVGGTLRTTYGTTGTTYTLPALQAAGTAANPSYTFSADDDSGMYRIGANNLGFAVNGTLEASVEAGYLKANNGFKIGATAVTSSAAELNYNDLSGSLGTTEASKVWTTDANGNTVHSEELQATCYLAKSVSLSGTTPTVDCDEGNAFSLSTTGNTTFTFSYAGVDLTTDDVYGFVLKVTAGGTHTITWPASVDWSGASAPAAPGSGETDLYQFVTYDGGTTWYGALLVDAAA